MKKNILFVLLSLCAQIGTAQYFQQDVSYDIDVSLDTISNTLQGSTQITYTNNSPQALDSFYLHLWMNAFGDKLSDFADQRLREDRLDFYFSDEDDLGGYQDLHVLVGGQRMEIYGYKGKTDVVYFTMPENLESGGSIEIFVNYKLKLPRFFSRTGRKTFDYYFMYWFPTPAVFDEEGWHPMPYLDMGEFYSEVGDYNINLNLPEGFNFISSERSGRTSRNLNLKADKLIDFAFVMSKNKEVYTKELKNGIQMDFMTRYPERVDRAVEILNNALPYFEDKIGPYPYKRLSIMDKGKRADSGMEYPRLITVSGADDESGDFEYYLIHELLHQYFYSALATNQRKYPWLDEGLTTYYQQRYYKEIKGEDHYSKKGVRLLQKGSQPLLHTMALGQAKRCYHKSLSTLPYRIDPLNYGLNAYEIPARMYAYLQDYLGDQIFDKGIQRFYFDWSGKHPGPQNLQIALEEESKKNLDWFFGDLIHKGWAYDYRISELIEGQISIEHVSGQTPPYSITFEDQSGNETVIWFEGHAGIKTHSIDNNFQRAVLDKKGLSMDINPNNNSVNSKRPLKLVIGPKLDNGRNREIYTLPTPSYNTSDGVVLGATFFNSTFPSKTLRWAFSPSYGLDSKKFIGEGWVSYDQYLKGDSYRKIQYKLNAKRYSFFKSETLGALSFLRVSPHVSLHFQHDPYDQKYSKVYFKPVFISQERFDFVEEEAFVRNDFYSLFRVGYEYYNFRGLGRSELKAMIEYHPYENIIGEQHDYTKLTVSAFKAFSISENRSIDFRAWGAYFLRNSQRESSNYNDGLSRGAAAVIHQGFNDYAFDEYFFNRNNQEASLANQISYLGGGFKTPFGSQYRLGQSNDLAFALNITSDLPFKMPSFFPARFFLDVGYARNKSTSLDPLEGESMFSGGFMLQYADGLFSIHVPLFQSQNISDIYNTEGIGLLGKISFQMDLVRFNPWDIAEDFSF